MYENQNGASRPSDQLFVEGMPVFDSAGEKVGSVHDYDLQGQYIIVQKGWLFPHNYYVPVTMVGSSDADGVYLNLSKDELRNRNLDTPPDARMAADEDYGTSATAGAVASSTTATAGGMTDAATMQSYDLQRDAASTQDMSDEDLIGQHAMAGDETRLYKDTITDQSPAMDTFRKEDVTVEDDERQSVPSSSAEYDQRMTRQDYER